jgi:hypothetical protein
LKNLENPIKNGKRRRISFVGLAVWDVVLDLDLEFALLELRVEDCSLAQSNSSIVSGGGGEYTLACSQNNSVPLQHQ